MNITIRWKDLDISSAAESYLNEKAKKLENFKFIHEDLKAEFTENKDHTFTVKLNVTAHNGVRITAESQVNNLQTAITTAIDKMLDQCRRYKDQHYQK